MAGTHVYMTGFGDGSHWDLTWKPLGSDSDVSEIRLGCLWDLTRISLVFMCVTASLNRLEK